MKRRLTKIQQRRIASYSNEQEGNWGLVVTHQGSCVRLVDNTGDVFEANLRNNVGAVVTGDEVLWQNLKDPVIVKLLDRRQLLKRPDRYKGEKLVAANIDQVLIVVANDPIPDLYSLDRYLVALSYYDLPAVIVFHKQDLAAPKLVFNTKKEGDKIVLTLDSVIEYYQGLGYQCLRTSVSDSSLKSKVKSKDNILELVASLCDKASILVGLSGVGKSSLLNAITGSSAALIGEVSKHTSKGKHTTSSIQLYPLVSNDYKQGYLIDSPGIRRFGLWNLQPKEILNGFVEFADALGSCKFRNCAHDSGSSNCALQEIANSSDLAKLRLVNYFRILSES